MIRTPPARDRANNELRRSALLGLEVGKQEGRACTETIDGREASTRAEQRLPRIANSATRAGQASLTRRLPEATLRP